MKDKRARDSSPKRSSKKKHLVEEPERLPEEMVLRSRRLAKDGAKPVAISKPGQLHSNSVVFDGLDYDLVGLGFNYPAKLVDRERFFLTAKGCQEAIRTLDFSRVELSQQPNWSFTVDREDSSNNSEENYASDDEGEEEDSDYDPEDDSPEHFCTTLDSPDAMLKVDGWSFLIECVQVKADKSSMKKREYKRLKKYDYMQTVFLVRRVVIDLGYEKRKEKERSGH